MSECCDRRSEEIALVFDEHARRKSYVVDVSTAWFYAAGVARSTIAKPKTREQVLEEALQTIIRFVPEARPTARRALEWRQDAV